MNSPAVLHDAPAPSGAASEAPEAVAHWRISGMYCAACAVQIEQALGAIDGVHETQVSASAERAQVRFDPRRTDAAALKAAIRRCGYGAAADEAAPAAALRRADERRALWRLGVAGLCMMQVMMYATPAYVAQPGDIAPDVQRLLHWASWLLSIPVLLFSAGPFFASAWHAMRQRRLSMDVPVALGIAVTFFASTGAAFDPGGTFGREVYFDSLTMFVFFLLGGRWLELRARHRVAAALEAALQRAPLTAWRLDDADRAEEVSASALAVGDRIRILAGAAVPADALVLAGRSSADEAMLTGESTPVAKALGDELSAGSLNLSAPLTACVIRTGRDTRHAGIVALMRGALTQRPRLARAADRLAGPFLWGVLLLAGLAALAWSAADPSRAVWVAVSVLIVTCPCALSLAAPAALLASAGALAREGVLLQRLDALEALAGVDRICFDKTGTLTLDRLEVARVEWLPASAGVDEAALREQAASLASLSSHPAAAAIARASPARRYEWREVVEIPGQGLQAQDAEGRVVRLGRQDFVTSTVAAQFSDDGAAVWFSRDGAALARFDLSEVLRADARAAVQRLKDAGLGVSMLSGDAPARARRTGATLGIEAAQGGATPAGKLDTIARAQAEGHRVAMVGDGLNDAPVLARADVSFAFAHGTALAQSAADIVLLGERLGVIADAQVHAKKTLRVIRQNLGWAVAYNAACIPLALAGWLPPWAAGLGMAASSLVVVLNALRLSRMRSRD